MTVQTEVVGEPARLSTFVDYRGRVRKSWQSPFLIDPDDHDVARDWHQKIEQEVREGLKRLAKSVRDRSETVGACLFAASMRAYATRDYDRARVILRGCEKLVPGDARVEAAFARLRSVASASRTSGARIAREASGLGVRARDGVGA